MGKYDQETIAVMTNKAARAIIKNSGHPDANRAIVQPLAWAEHYESTARALLDESKPSRERLEELDVDVPDWGLNGEELLDVIISRLREGMRERRRALAMIGLADYPAA